jgi:hypothetical protein
MTCNVSPADQTAGETVLFREDKPMMDQYLRDAGGMNPLAMGEPIRGLFWRLQVSLLAPQKSQKSVQKLVSRAVEMKPESPAPVLPWAEKRAG